VTNNNDAAAAFAAAAPYLPKLYRLDDAAAGAEAPLGHTIAESDPSWRIANIRAMFGRTHARLHLLPEYRKPKESPLAIVAGGPSLESEFTRLRSFDTVMVCGSAHDYLVGRGIRPRYAVLFDPAPAAAEYLTRAIDGTTYLVASSCAGEIFDALRFRAVAVWHAMDQEIPEAEYRGEPSVEGGGFALLRGIVLGLLLGYRVQHIFGADCSYGPIRTHAYASYDPPPARIRLAVGAPDGPAFDTSLLLMAQAQQFAFHRHHFRSLLRTIVHGEGLLAAMINSQGKENA